MPGFKTYLGFGLVVLFIGGTARADEASKVRIQAESLREKPRKWSGEWSVEAGGAGFNEGKDEGRTSFTYFRSKLNYKFADFLQLRTQPRVDFYFSQLQQRFDNDDMESKFRLAEAVLSLTPTDYLEFNAGAINQSYLNSSMLISRRRAFPGLQEMVYRDFNAGKGRVKIGVVAAQTIPTSFSLSTERQDKEPLASFNTQALTVSGKFPSDMKFDVVAGHYSWSNLPDHVAFQSAIAGNSVIGEVAPGARFRYGFDGFFLTAQGCACSLTSWGGLNLGFERIRNGSAAEGFGNAQSWSIGPHLKFSDITLDVVYRNFFIEKDTTVAYYTSSFTGNTNRMGDEVEMKLDFIRYGFAVRAEWMNAVPIRSNSTQDTMTSVLLGVESHYAPF